MIVSDRCIKKVLHPQWKGLLRHALTSQGIPSVDRRTFEAELHQLEVAIVDVCIRHFEQRGQAFDHTSLLECTTVDIDTFVKEIFFYGANIIPVFPEDQREEEAAPVISTSADLSTELSTGTHS